MTMELVKASDISAVVHKAVESLQELGNITAEILVFLYSNAFQISCLFFKTLTF